MSSNENELQLAPNTIMEKKAKKLSEHNLPVKYRENYLRAYNNFTQWKNEKQVDSNSEGLLPELHYYWQMYPYIFGGFLCKMHKFLAAIGTWASVLTIVAFSIERYFAVCHPLRSRCLGNKRAGTVIFAIWAMSTLISLPNVHLFQIKMISLKIYNGTEKESQLSKTCFPASEVYKYYGYMYNIYPIVLFFIPLVILAVVYIKIWLTLRTNSKMVRNCGIQNNCAENKRIVRVLVAVVLAFFVCGAPFHYQRLDWSEGKLKSRDDLARERIVLVATAVFYYFSATINPILYNAMSKRYRKAFMETIWMKASPTSQDGTLMNVTKTCSIKKINTISN